LEGADWHSSDLEQQKCKVDDSLKLTLTELESERRKNAEIERSNVSLTAEVEVLKNTLKTNADEAAF
jgi:hypothetical protein